MDNELYGAPIGKSRSRLLNGSYNDDYKYDDEDYQNIDPVSMTLDDYITRRPRRRGFGIGKFFGNRNRGSGTGRFIPAKKRFGYLDFDNFVPFLFDDQKRQRRNRGQNVIYLIFVTKIIKRKNFVHRQIIMLHYEKILPRKFIFAIVLWHYIRAVFRE